MINILTFRPHGVTVTPVLVCSATLGQGVGTQYLVSAMTMVVRRLWIVGNRCPLSTEDTGQQSTELNINADSVPSIK